MPRRSVGDESDDPAMHALRPKMACLSFLPGSAVVCAGDSPLTEQTVPPRRWVNEPGMRSERNVIWKSWKGDLSPRRLETTSVWRNARTGDRQQEPLGIISVWIYTWVFARSGGCSGAAVERSYLATMRRNNQRKRLSKSRRTRAAPMRDGN